MARKFGITAAVVGGSPFDVKADSAVTYDTRTSMVAESVPAARGGRAGYIERGMVPFLEVELVCTPAEAEEVMAVKDASAQFFLKDGTTLAGDGATYVGDGSYDAATGAMPCRFEFDGLDVVGA